MSSYASSYASSSDGELPDPYTLLRRPRIATANPPSTAPPPQSPGLFDPPTPPPVKKRTGLQVRSSGGNGRRSPPRKAKAAVVTYREIESGASTATEGSVSAWEPGTSEDSENIDPREPLEPAAAKTPPRRRRRRLVRGSQLSSPPASQLDDSDSDSEDIFTTLATRIKTIDLTGGDSTPRAAPARRRPQGTSIISRSSSDEDDLPTATLTYSPPRPVKPSPKKRLPPVSALNANTKPRTPATTLLPRKPPVIPPSPHRSDSEEFWDAEETINWVDAHSPQKLPPPILGAYPTLSATSSKPRKYTDDDFVVSDSVDEEEEDNDDDGALPIPYTPKPATTAGPGRKKAAATTPAVDAEKQKRRAKKEFDSRKRELATKFLAELDAKIGGGAVGRKTAPTGGVQLLWSKTLRTTAGQAKWKRRQQVCPGHIKSAPQLHYASIELSEKVVDSDEKLYNVLAHEFCHLATFLISEVTKPPHGAEFKKWAACASRTFAHRNVAVTTTHSYTIDAKFHWTCQNERCNYVYKRHSASIDPARQQCGACRGGRLLQTRPVPREKRPQTDYQAFMKENYARIREEAPTGTPRAEVMKRVGAEYRRCKEERERMERGKVGEDEDDDGVEKQIAREAGETGAGAGAGKEKEKEKERTAVDGLRALLVGLTV